MSCYQGQLALCWKKGAEKLLSKTGILEIIEQGIDRGQREGRERLQRRLRKSEKDSKGLKISQNLNASLAFEL